MLTLFISIVLTSYESIMFWHAPFALAKAGCKAESIYGTGTDTACSAVLNTTNDGSSDDWLLLGS